MGSMRHDNERLDTALMLQKCDDFVLLDLKHKNWTSAIAGKSNYWGNSFANHFDKFLTKEIKKRFNVVSNIEKNLDKKIEIKVNDSKKLLETGVVLIINDKQRDFFPKDITAIDLRNNDTVLLFLNHEKKSSFLRNCKPLL